MTVKALNLSDIIIYPIKGCAGISLKNSLVQDRGLEFDRRWMLVDENGDFVSQRSTPGLALVKLSLNGFKLICEYGGNTLEINTNEVFDQELNTVVWDDKIKGYLTNSNYHEWFSTVLNKSVRLVQMQSDSIRPVDPRYAVSKKEEVSFADGYPFLVIGENSLDLLNSKLSESTDYRMDRFRPNLVFSGGDAHEEDTWREFSIGKTTFIGVKPCARCQVTTINQQTLEKGKEPLKTLATYRKSGAKILFGQNCLLKSGMEIKVGDEIIIHSNMPDPIS